MSDRELLAMMTSVMMRDSVPDAFQRALAVLQHVDEHLLRKSENVPMSRPAIKESEEEPKHRRAK